MSSSFAEARRSAVISIAPIVLPSPGRGVDLHVRVSAPVVGEALPVLIFSHGNGQSLYAYGPLADYWAAHGFVVIQPTHLARGRLAFPLMIRVARTSGASVRRTC